MPRGWSWRLLRRGSKLSRVVNAQGPPRLRQQLGRALLVVRGAPVLMVEADPARVEQALATGELACPGCGGVLGGWGWARGRWLRGRDGVHQRLCPRRGRCRACRATHVLLPVTGLLRRLDAAEVIGAGVAGHGRRAQPSPDRCLAGCAAVHGAGLAWPVRRSGGADRRALCQAGGLAGSQRSRARAARVTAGGCGGGDRGRGRGCRASAGWARRAVPVRLGSQRRSAAGQHQRALPSTVVTGKPCRQMSPGSQGDPRAGKEPPCHRQMTAARPSRCSAIR